MELIAHEYMMFDLASIFASIGVGGIVMYTLFWAILGSILGSFLNVVALRYNTGFSINGRSGCFVCGKKLAWYELIPIVSYVIQQGHCRECSAKISPQYFLVELGSALFFAVFGLYYMDTLLTGSTIGFLGMLVQFIIACCLIVIFLYDMRHKIIPNGVAYTFIVFALVYMVLGIAPEIITGNVSAYTALNKIVAGILVTAPLAALWDVSQGRWIGWGDIKLALGIGSVLGLTLGFSALLIAFYLGAFIGIVMLFTSRNAHMRTEIPFGPFLIIAFYIVFFTGLNVITFM